ncbi:RNA polymerase sigma factor SigY [Cytobacillus gottheilii]|uniref:RNA polymerase sigma factor SigY n=1 Tax=Cytobacillus gottheilii TaxID=859144 RepID=UPI0009B9AF95|nr:RNA polymerase sigma factor SigY [Cytobacillus gottheilii]
MEDKILIQKAKKGDQHSLAVLLHSHYSFLFKYCIKLTMNKHTAEDLTQETIAKVIEKISLYKGEAKFSSWLITIATNVYVDNKRKNSRHQLWKQDQMQQRQMRWQMEYRNEDWNDTMQALGTLSDNMRIPIILKHYYGYSYADIAEMMNKSEGTIKSRVHNGIEAIRKELKTDNGESK